MDERTTLLVAAQDGDRSALAAFIRASEPEVWRLARHLVGPEAADDVTQEVFIRAWRSLPRFRAESSARTWLLSIARRTCADAVRRRQRDRRLHDRLATAHDGGVAGDRTGGTDVAALVAQLPHDRREAFVLTQVLGLSYEDAAAIVGVPIGTIRSRVSRSREALVEAIRAAEAV